MILTAPPASGDGPARRPEAEESCWPEHVPAVSAPSGAVRYCARNVRPDRWMRAGRARRSRSRCSPRATRCRCSMRTPRPSRCSTAGRTTSWEDLGGSFTVGTALEIDALLEAGVERADAFVASTDGDNTNLVIAQIAQRRFNVTSVVVARARPGRARWYARAGPADRLPHADRHRAAGGRGPGSDSLRGGLGLDACVDVHPDRRRRQGGLEPGARAGRKGARGDRDRGQPPSLRGGRGGARARRSSTATAPSCGCWSAPASSAPTW